MNGVIQSHMALIDPAALGLKLTVRGYHKAPDHGSVLREAFHAAVTAMQSFDRFYASLTDVLPIRDVTSHAALGYSR